MQYQKYRDTTLNELDGMYICDHLVGNHEADIVIIGSYKSASGNSREHGKIGLRELCKIKTISLAK